MLYIHNITETKTHIDTTFIDNNFEDENITIYQSSYENQLYKHQSKNFDTNLKHQKLLHELNSHKKIIHKRHTKQSISNKFKCDKRKYCSQMHSYEEAKYFLKHCSNVKMDGDYDGIPCERQFGRYD